MAVGPLTGQTSSNNRYKQYLAALFIALLINLIILLLFWLLLTYEPSIPHQILPTDDQFTVTFDSPFTQNVPYEVPAALVPGRNFFGSPAEHEMELPQEKNDASGAAGDPSGDVADTKDRPDVCEKPKESQISFMPLQKIIDLTKFALANLRSQQASTPNNKPVASSTKEDQQSLTNFAPGFLDSLDKGGSDSIERDGDRTKRPSIEDTKWISYIERIGWHLQRSARICGLGYQTPYPARVQIRFQIDLMGNTSNLCVVRSAGDHLDHAALALIKGVGSFATIPKHLERTYIDLGLVFQDDGRIGFHIYNR